MKQPKSRVVRFFAFLLFILYSLISFPYYVVKRWIINYRYDKEYSRVFKEGKKAFNTPSQTFNLTFPKEVYTLKPRGHYEK